MDLHRRATAEAGLCKNDDGIYCQGYTYLQRLSVSPTSIFNLELEALHKKGMFLYSTVSSQLDRSKRFTLPPGRSVHSDTNSASPGIILATQQLCAKIKSLTFSPLSIARYTFIQLSQLGHQWRERKCPILETAAKGDSNPGSLDCESGILPLSYRAPFVCIATS